MRRLLAVTGMVLGAGVILALGTWAFMAYTSPDRVLDFATFLQMCGIPLSR